MKNIIIKKISICLIICLLSISFYGCGNKDITDTSSINSHENTSSQSNSLNNNLSSENPDVTSSNIIDSFANDDLDFSDLFNSFSTSVDVNFNSVPSQNNHTGLAGVLPCYWFLPDNTLEDGYSDEDIALCIKRLLQMGVSVVRTHNFQPGYAWDEENKCWDWDSEYMTGFYKYADIMKENNIDIIINTTEGFCSSSRIGEPIVPVDAELPSKDFDSNGITKESLDYNSACADIYADWTVQFVKEVIIKRGYSNIKYFMYATEPGGNVETFEQNEYSFQLYLMYLKASDEALKNAGLRNMVKFVGPNVASWPVKSDSGTSEKAKKWMELAVEYGNEYIDIYSFHRYLHTSFSEDTFSVWEEFVEDIKDVIAPMGKPIWIDEWNVTDGGIYTATASDPLKATQIALAQISMMSSGADSSIVWYLFDIKFPNSKRNSTADAIETYFEGIHLSGMDKSVLMSTIPYNTYYVYCMLGSAIKAGDTVYGSVSDSGIHSILLKHNDNTYSIISVCMEMLETEVSYNLPFDLNNRTFTKTVYNPYQFKADTNGTPIPATSTVKIGKSFDDTLGAYQVVVYNQK